MTDQIILLEEIEKQDENNAILKFSDGSEEKANKNENGWAAHGTDENGNNWETEDFDSLEELVDDLETFKNKG